MPWEDWLAWSPWITNGGSAWPWYAYNVRLSVGDPEQPIPEPESAALWETLSAKRIDAVGYRDGVYAIFEARRLPGWSAVAQLMGYRDLWHLNYPELELGDLWLISEKCDPVVRALAVRQRIRTWCTGEP